MKSRACLRQSPNPLDSVVCSRGNLHNIGTSQKSIPSPARMSLFRDTRLIENAKIMQIITKTQMCIIWVTFVGLARTLLEKNSQAGGMSSGKFMHLPFTVYYRSLNKIMHLFFWFHFAQRSSWQSVWEMISSKTLDDRTTEMNIKEKIAGYGKIDKIIKTKVYHSK